MNPAKRTRLNNFLTTFLEIGKFIEMSDKLKSWCKKLNMKRSQVPTKDMTKINSWPLFIATLVDLAERSTKK